jgi:actin-related protein 5
VEQKLLAYDPTFTPQHTHASIATKRSALLSAFRPTYEEGDVEGVFCLPIVPHPLTLTAGNARIHLSTERWRVCETYFAPSMAGVDSAGLGEVIQNVLARFTEEEKGRLVKVTFSSPTVMVDTDFPS